MDFLDVQIKSVRKRLLFLGSVFFFNSSIDRINDLFYSNIPYAYNVRRFNLSYSSELSSKFCFFDIETEELFFASSFPKVFNNFGASHLDSTIVFSRINNLCLSNLSFFLKEPPSVSTNLKVNIQNCPKFISSTPFTLNTFINYLSSIFDDSKILISFPDNSTNSTDIIETFLKDILLDSFDAKSYEADSFPFFNKSSSPGFKSFHIYRLVSNDMNSSKFNVIDSLLKDFLFEKSNFSFYDIYIFLNQKLDSQLIARYAEVHIRAFLSDLERFIDSSSSFYQLFNNIPPKKKFSIRQVPSNLINLFK